MLRLLLPPLVRFLLSPLPHWYLPSSFKHLIQLSSPHAGFFKLSPAPPQPAWKAPLFIPKSTCNKALVMPSGNNPSGHFPSHMPVLNLPCPVLTGTAAKWPFSDSRQKLQHLQPLSSAQTSAQRLLPSRTPSCILRIPSAPFLCSEPTEKQLLLCELASLWATAAALVSLPIMEGTLIQNPPTAPQRTDPEVAASLSPGLRAQVVSVDLSHAVPCRMSDLVPGSCCG